MTSTQQYPYYQFAPNKYEGRYWNANGYATAVVASVAPEGAWAAYIGGGPPEREEDCLAFVAKWGCKLDEATARYFFPDIDLPYRP
jgi:hypothetical protein